MDFESLFGFNEDELDEDEFDEDEYNDLLAEAEAENDPAAWLASEPNWANRLGEGWKPVRPLGSGTFGTTGHYRYEGAQSVSYENVVVKQTLSPEYGEPGGAVQEGQILALFTNNNNATPHIIQLLGGPFTDIGNNKTTFDRGRVERIYLEFMPNGNLRDYFDKSREENLDFNEAVAWSLFYCLAKACLAMDSGREDVNAEPWQHTQVWHNDIKSDNVFLGGNDEGEHKEFLLTKLADFGLSELVPGTKDKMDEFVREKQRNNSTFFPAMPPEFGQNTFLTHKKGEVYTSNHPVIGTPSNVWQVGWLMYNLVRRSSHELAEMNDEEGLYVTFENGVTGITFGAGMLGGNMDPLAQSSKYSQHFRFLILQCLMGEPDLRPSAQELVERTRRSVGAIAAAPAPPVDAPGEDRAAAARARDRQAREDDDSHLDPLQRKLPQGQATPPRSSPAQAPPGGNRKIAPLPAKPRPSTLITPRTLAQPPPFPPTSATPETPTPRPRPAAPRQEDFVGAEPCADPYYPDPPRPSQRKPK